MVMFNRAPGSMAPRGQSARVTSSRADEGPQVGTGEERVATWLRRVDHYSPGHQFPFCEDGRKTSEISQSHDGGAMYPNGIWGESLTPPLPGKITRLPLDAARTRVPLIIKKADGCNGRQADKSPRWRLMMMIRLWARCQRWLAVASQDRHRPRRYAIGHGGQPTPYRRPNSSLASASPTGWIPER